MKHFDDFDIALLMIVGLAASIMAMIFVYRFFCLFCEFIAKGNL